MASLVIDTMKIHGFRGESDDPSPNPHPWIGIMFCIPFPYYQLYRTLGRSTPFHVANLSIYILNSVT